MTLVYHLISDRTKYIRSLPEIAAEAEAAGVEYFQLREKDLPVGQLLQTAREVRRKLSASKFIVNGRFDVALAAEADGVHLQKEAIPVSTIKKKYPDLIVGYSAHSRDELFEAEREGADYLFISPVFSPLSKQLTLQPLGPQGLADCIRGLRTRVFALGGITGSNIKQLEHTGINGVAGISLFIHNGFFNREYRTPHGA